MYEHKEWQGSINLIKLIIPVAQFALDLLEIMMLH